MGDVTASAAGGIRVDLGSAGHVTLTLNVNLTELAPDDLQFVLDILRMVVGRAARRVERG